VDARLRPSGQQGALVTSFEAFERYQCEDARTWEHLALVRARVITGPRPDAQARLARPAVVLEPVVAARSAGAEPAAPGALVRRLVRASLLALGIRTRAIGGRPAANGDPQAGGGP